MWKICTFYITVALTPILAATPIIAKADTVTTFVSDTSWDVYTGDPAGLAPVTYLGKAQEVSPDEYGFDAGAAWSADLSSIPGAVWIWAPGVTGSTIPADLDSYYFSKHFVLSDPDYIGYIQLNTSVDDYAEIIINGHVVGSFGSTTDYDAALAAQNTLTTFNISSWLRQGSNTITIYASNGPASFAHGGQEGEWPPSPYSVNPAGIVFGGTIEPYAHVPAPVPEPSTMLFLGSGLVGLIGYGRKRLSRK